MKPTTVYNVYFSATGTTKKVTTALATQLAEMLGAQYQELSFTLPAARGNDLRFGKDDLVVLGTPVYAGRVPNLLLPYIKEKIIGDGALGIPVVLYGNRNFDDALMELRNVMTENGFHTVSACAMVGEHSFSRILGAGRPDAADMALVTDLAEKTAKLVLMLDAPPAAPVAVEGNDPIKPYYTPRDRKGAPIEGFLQAKPVTDMDKCTNCGLCAALCPMGSIDFNDVSQVTGKCIKCCACIKGCPTGAKIFTHAGYAYHQHELEEQYGGTRAESKIFY